MKENKGLNEYIKSIGEWATQDEKRVAFVVCGKITEDGVETANSFVGRTDRIARALFSTAMEYKENEKIIKLVAKMMENPLLSLLISMKASKDEIPETVSRSDKDIKDVVKDLLGAIEDKIRKND